jgi:hypothetical protein
MGGFAKTVSGGLKKSDIRVEEGGGEKSLVVRDKTVSQGLQAVENELGNLNEFLQDWPEIKVNIADSSNGRKALVNSNNALDVSTLPVPYDAYITNQDAFEQSQVLYEYMTDSAGSNDMAIDASAAVTKFSISQTAKRIKIIESVKFIFHSANMNIESAESRRFGPVVGGLTNGLVFQAKQKYSTQSLFLENVTVIGDFYKYIDNSTKIVNDRDAISSGVDYFMVVMQLPNPVFIFPGTVEELKVEINDDLSGIELFNVVAVGRQESTL